MEQFVVSARKYRPQDFEAVVGQKHITDTLMKSVESDHLAQALLFCGPRGVGKTSCARILAKVINRDSKLTDEELALNIFELDAASNNSVDDIRRLIDQVRFAPQTGKFKVYIIDEVHMLSQQAFNAFLKTLEEPPAHAIFILATTEKHKIIPTILSRCQIFDFKRITIADIAEHLAFVAQKEGVEAEVEALHLIAEKADGALRDALSLFDRMVSFSGNKLTYDQVVEVLDILDYTYFFKSVDLANAVNYPDLMLLYNEVLEKGFSGHEYVNGMAKHFRDLLVSREPKTVSLLEVGPSVKERYLQQSRASSTRFLLHGLKVFNELDGQYKMASQPRILVELGLLKLVEFISQEKKKSQPRVSPNSTDAYLPTAIPTPEAADTNEGATVAGENSVEAAGQNDGGTRDAVSAAKGTGDAMPKATEAAPSGPSVQPTTQSPAPLGLGSASASNATGTNADLSSATNDKSKGRPTLRRTAAAKGAGTKVQGPKGLGGLSLKAELESVGGQLEPSAAEAAADLLPPPPSSAGPQEKFSEAALRAALDDYAAQRHVGRQLRTLLKNQPIRIEHNNVLVIEVVNNIQFNIFNEGQKQLVPYLRDTLKNRSIKFEVDIKAHENVKVPYLPEEKFEHMLQRNPALGYLRSKLNTDIQ